MKYQCVLCSRNFNSRQGLTCHVHRTHDNPGISYGGHQKGKPAWNKGLNKNNDIRVLNNSIAVSKAKIGKPGHKHTEETKKILSKKLSTNNKGGRCKWFTVNNQKVQGTWERDIAIKLSEMNIIWEKLKTNNHTFSYEINNKIHSYTPDFYLKEYGVYLEIKGYWWGNDKRKMDIILNKYPNEKIVIVEREQFRKIMQGELVW